MIGSGIASGGKTAELKAPSSRSDSARDLFRFGMGSKSLFDEDNGSANEKDDEGNVKQISIDVPNIINNNTPTWMLKPADLKDDDYKNFYREIYPMNMEDSFFNIHLNVDFPFDFIR